MSAATNVKVSRDDKRWEAEISAELPAEALSKYREEALKEIQQGAKLDGFRPGKAPIERIIQIYGEPTVLRHAAEHAIKHELPEILAAEGLPVVETPRVSIESPEVGKPLKFTARAALAPEVKLPDYNKIAARINSQKQDTNVSDEEHAQAVAHLRRERARIDRIESGTEPQKAAEETRALAENDLPALDDQFVRSLGYENAEKFSEALRTNIKNEKELQAAQKRRAAILDELVKESSIRYPSILLDYELDDMEARLASDLSQIGQTIESFLAQQKKTREQVRADWTEAADKRAKIRLLLSEIARKENIELKQEDLEHEIKHAKKHYPQADIETLRAHIAHAMRNELTLKRLESLS
ncbi:MAG TPA: trigger factor [Candidatus Paceibacterota bacterium]|jgi:FKBP-type peptidyl-prolyl cis-trans isomerase (trigger factor)|nr:trigger factor [Candidatus Paceibacterota bacterium]